MTNITKTNGKTEAPKAETIPEMSSVLVPLSIVKAALMCAGKDETRFYLQGIFVHTVRVDGQDPVVRVVSTDGHRMFVANVPQPDDGPGLPEWGDAGVIVPSDALRRLASVFAGFKTERLRISYATGADKIEVSDVFGDLTARLTPIDGAFPAYQRIIESTIGAFSADELGDFDPVSFSSEYIKDVGSIASALDKSDRIIRMYAHSKSEASIVTFAVPGVVLYLMPCRRDQTMPAETAAILSPAVKGTVAALRAHKTRLEQQAEAEANGSRKSDLIEKARDYERRIAEVLRRAGSEQAIEGPGKDKGAAETADATPEATRPDLSKAVGEPKADARRQKARTGNGKASAKPAGFEAWQRAVNAAIVEKTGVGLDDLPDVPIRDWYDARMSAKTAATRAIEYAMAA